MTPRWWMRLVLFLLVVLGCGCTGMRPVNPGAQCEIVSGLTDNGMAIMAEHEGAHCDGGFPRGLWCETDGGHERIYVRDMVGPGGFTLLHEYQHHLEHALELAGDRHGLIVARHAFRQLMCDDFEIGQEDLMTEIP